MKGNLKRMLAGTMAFALAFSLTACGSNTESEAVSDSDASSTSLATPDTATTTANVTASDEELTVALMSEPTTLFALGGTATESGLIIENAIGGRLLEYDAPTGEITPSLADSYELVDDTHAKFHIRDGACYSDGTPVTAADVLYSFSVAQENANSFTTYMDLANSTAEDDQTVIIAFTEYVPGWEQLFANPAATITSEANVTAAGGAEAAGHNPPIGCGRYVFKEWSSGQYITIERNENYWDDSYTGYYKTIRFTFIPDAAARVLALQSGDADVAQRIAMSDYMALQNNPDAKGITFSTDRVFSMFFNVQSDIFSNEKVREAVAHAIDPQAVNALQNMGQGQVVQGWLTPTHPYYKEYYEGGHPAYDPEQAKALLAEAGYPDGFDCTMVTQASTQQIATVLQESLRQVGINMEIQTLEQSTYVATMRAGDYDCYVGATTAGTLSTDNFNQLDPAKIGVTIGGYRDDRPEVTAMIEKASSSDEATAQAGWDEIIDLVYGQYYLVGLCDAIDCYGLAGNLEGLKLGKLNYMDVSYVHPAA